MPTVRALPGTWMWQASGAQGLSYSHSLRHSEADCLAPVVKYSERKEVEDERAWHTGARSRIN